MTPYRERSQKGAYGPPPADTTTDDLAGLTPAADPNSEAAKVAKSTQDATNTPKTRRSSK